MVLIRLLFLSRPGSTETLIFLTITRPMWCNIRAEANVCSAFTTELGLRDE